MEKVKYFSLGYIAGIVSCVALLSSAVLFLKIVLEG